MHGYAGVPRRPPLELRKAGAEGRRPRRPLPVRRWSGRVYPFCIPRSISPFPFARSAKRVGLRLSPPLTLALSFPTVDVLLLTERTTLTFVLDGVGVEYVPPPHSQNCWLLPTSPPLLLIPHH